MLDSGTKPIENRIHLFDPVGLINDGYGGTYRSSNYASRPRRPTKSYSNFEEVNTNNNNTNDGLKSYDSFNTNVIESNGVVAGIRSYDSYTDGINNTGLRSYNSFSMEANVGGKKELDHTTTNTNNSNIDITISSNNNVDDRNNNNGVEIRFGVVSNNNNNVEDENDDVCTPRLWKSNSPSTASSPRSMNSSLYFNGSTSPVNNNHGSSMSLNSSPVHPTNQSKHKNYQQQHQPQQSVSQSSRTQAIAKGRKELMDMVRDLPESFYELSLKDIVDKKAEFGVQKGGSEMMIPEEKKGVGKEIIGSPKTMETKKAKKSGKKVKKSESKKKMVRSRSSVDNGRFRLRNSVFPIFSGSRKNKKRLMGSNSFQIAPMPKQNPSSNESMKVVEKDWWKRKSCMSSESEDNKDASSSSSNSSSRSSSINERRSSRFLPTCCLFNGRRIRSKK